LSWVPAEAEKYTYEFAGLLDIPSKGTVFLNSKDISELDESELARIRVR
jgi:ABC-type lipoprotein export system ATPase subunit